MKLKDKVALITGASRGIGADIASRMAGEGASVIVNYAGNKALAEEVVAGIQAAGGTAAAFQADISDAAQVTALFDFALAQFGKIDILVNNAGYMKTVTIGESSDDDFTTTFDINVRGVFHALREAKTKLADNGIIINCSSSTVKMMLPGYGIYSASKAAVEQLTRVFSKEIGRGISVNAIAPGPTSTDLFLNGKTEETIARLASLNAFNRLAQTEDISKVVLFLASEDAKWISGQVILANGAMV